MKNVLIAIVLLASMSSYAGKLGIICQKEPGMSQGALAIELDKTEMDPNSKYYRLASASWVFNYSSARLVCSTDLINLNRKEAFQCVGYLQPGAKIEISVVLNGGKGAMKVRNIGRHIYASQTNGMQIPCQIQENAFTR